MNAMERAAAAALGKEATGHKRVDGTDYTGQETQWHDEQWVLTCRKCGSGFRARVPTKKRYYRQQRIIRTVEKDGTVREELNEALFPELVIQPTVCEDCKAGRRKKKQFDI